MFFTAVHASSSLVLRTVFNIISVSIFSTPYLSPTLALGVSPLLVSKAAFGLDFMVVKLGFILDAVYNHSLTG
jgi:hypothetical protein